MLVLPPDYPKSIVKSVEKISAKAVTLLEEIITNMLNTEQTSRIKQVSIDQLRLKIRQTETLIRFQNDESTYHPLIGQEKSQFLRAEVQIALLRIFHYHIDNLNRVPIEHLHWSEAERELISVAVMDLGSGFKNTAVYDFENHTKQLEGLTKMFWRGNETVLKRDKQLTKLPSEIMVLYELIALYNLVNQYYHEGGV